MGHRIGRTLVGELLHKLDYSLQANRKTREGSSHPDRDAQFCYINACRRPRASGTRSSIVSSRSSPPIGVAGCHVAPNCENAPVHARCCS
jgi:Rhodopirellula transposase DDE domain